MSDIQQALYDFDATIKAKPELTDSDLLELFPELEGDTARLRAAYDYSATLNSGKYKGPEEFNAKFPELFGESEKPRYQMPTAEKQYVAPVLGGKQPEQAPQENILPDYKAMDAARTMTPTETNQVLNQGVPGVTRIGDTNISHLQTDMLMNEKFGGGYKDTSAGRTEEVTPVGEMETGVEMVGAPLVVGSENDYRKPQTAIDNAISEVDRLISEYGFDNYTQTFTAGSGADAAAMAAAGMRTRPEDQLDIKQVAIKRNLFDAKKMLSEADKILNSPIDQKTGTWADIVSDRISSWAKGAGEKIVDQDLWDMGMSAISRNLGAMEIAKKIERNQPLSTDEQLLLDAFANTQYANMMRADNMSAAYTGGKGTVEMAKFIAELATAGGVGRLATKGVEKTLTKAIAEGVEGKIKQHLATIGTKIATRSAAAAIGAAISPTAMENTTANLLGKVYGDFNGNDLVAKGRADAMTGFDAYVKAWADTSIEFATESAGGSIGIVGKIIKGIPGVDTMLTKLAKTKAGKIGSIFGANEVLKKAGVHGFFGEYNEEFDGAVARHLIGLEDFKESFWNWDAQAVLMYTLAPVSGFSAGANIAQHASIYGKYKKSDKEFDELMLKNGIGREDVEELKVQMLAASPEELGDILRAITVSADNGVVDGQINTDIYGVALQYAIDASRYNAYNQGFDEKIQEFNQRAEQYVTDNLNPDMNALVFAEFQGQPVRVVSGVVQMKDNEIDTEVSTPEIYIETQDGIKIIPPQLLDARKGLRITPAQQAVQEIAQQAAEPVVAQHENEEVRPYNEGEIVRAEIAGSPVLGTIVGKTEQGYTIRDAQGVMIQIQPRQIINEDNLEGVDNESVVEYRDQSGAIRTGVVTDIYSERVQGYAYIDDQRIPFKDILGLKTDEVIVGQPQNAGSAPVTNNNLSELPPPPANLLNDGNGNITEISPAGATQDAEQAAQAPYPVTKTGELDFDNFTPEQLFSYTAQEFGEQAAIEDVKASIAGLEAQLSKKKKAFEKMGMKDRVKARAEISKIEAEIAAFSNLIPTAPVETAPPSVESAPATQLSTPPAQQSAPAPEVSAPVENTPSAKKRRAVKDGAKKNTTGRPQWLVNKVRRSGEPKNLRELIMHKLIFGAKLRWNDIVSENKAILTRGLGGEYRYAEAERKPRANSMMGYVSESGMTPEQLAHQIWEANAFEDGQFEDIPLTEYDTQQILDEILDVANTYPTVSGMARDLEEWAEKIEREEKDYFDAIMEMEQEDGLPMAEEFEMFVDNIPQEAIDNSLRAANFTPEELNELFEFLNNVYENDEQGGSRGTKEDAEASGNNESGNEIQAGRDTATQGAVNQRGDSGSSPADQRAEQGAGRRRITDEINSQQPKLNPSEAQKEANKTKHFYKLEDTVTYQGQTYTVAGVGTVETGELIYDLADESGKIVHEDVLQEEINTEVEENPIDQQVNSQSHNDNPTEKQKESGVYDKARVNIQGYNITIETRKGQQRSGVDSTGKPWSITMNNHYGELDGTKGYDGDPIDVFIGPNPEGQIFVIDQVLDGKFDESKVMLGFDSAEQAREAYMSNFEKGWQGFGSITPAGENFKQWLYDGAKQRKPFSEYKDTPAPVKPIEGNQAENEADLKPIKEDVKGIEGKKKPLPTTVRELADYDAGEQKGYLSGMFFSGLEKGSKFNVARKDYEVTQYSKPKKVEFVGKKGNQTTYDEITIRIKELATGKTITTKLITWPNGNSQFTGVESNQNHEQLSRDIEGDVNTDLINEYNRFHEKSDSFKIIQKQIDKLNSQPENAKQEVKPKQPIEAVEPQSPIDNLNAILSGEKVVEAPTLEDQLKAAEQKLSTVKKDRDKKYRRYLDLKEKLDEIGSRDQVDVEGNVGNGMFSFEELDKEAKEKVNAARKEYEPLNEQAKELESKIDKLQGRIKDQKMNQQEMNFDEPVEEIKEPNKVSQAQAEADAALQDFMDAFNDLNNLGIVDNTAEKQAKLLIAGTKMVGAFTKLGVYKFAELVKAIQAKGIQVTDDLLSAIKKSYGAFAAENDFDELDDMKTVRAFKIEEKPAMEIVREIFEGNNAEVAKTDNSSENNTPSIENKQRFINAVVEKLGNEKLNIVSLRKIADESGLGNIKDTTIQEYTELAIIMKARAIAKQDISQEDKFRQIVELYQAQPTISMRSSERIDKQQYSTPIPLSFLAGEFINKINPKSVLEPSAGNGMMVFNVDEQVVIANEIDEVRLENLRDQGFKVTNQDGTLEFNIEPVDAVVTNPPFGKSEAREYEGYKISGLDEQMTINALLSMKDNGRAAIIIGGHTKYKDNGTLAAEKAFINYLYDKYNVVDIINVDGSLYRKQGTSFPIRMILINGRRTGFESLARKYAPLQKDARSEQVSTFEELFNRIQENENNLLRKGESIRVNNGTQPATESDRGDVQGVSARPNRQGSTSQGKPGTSSFRPSQNGGLSNTTGLSSVDDAGRPNMEDNALDRGDDDGTNNRPGSNRGVQRKDVSEFLNGSNARPEPLKIDLSKEKTPYPSRSKSEEIGSVVPTNVAQTINEILHKFKDIDSYVQYKLGYQSKEELFGALSAEQIDSVALAIYQIENNRALIIGDMTGVGKGRQAAAIIRYAAFHGHKPVFITEKAHLFSDIYRDLRDIGSANLRPFIFNAKSADADPSMTDENGVVVYKVLSPKVRNAVLAGQSLPDEYDYAVLSYSQLSGDTEKNGLSTKQSFLTNIARNNVLILDESHNAGGDGNTGTFLTELLQETKGVVFLSGTFAKRADNMPIYAIKTSMSDANMSDTELIEAIKKGGVPLQEIMSKNLTETGQMVRRERDFSGVTIDWQTMTEAKEQHFKTFDGVIEVFNELIEFQKEYVDPVIETINADLADEQGGAEARQGTANLGISNVPFASKTFNLVRQLLFSLKAKEVAAEAIKELQKGNKPVIAVGNTMEAFLNEMGQVGDVVQKHDYSLTLLRGLTGLFRITRVDANNERHHEEIGLDAIGEAGRRRYAELEDKINKLSSGISISPIDVIKKEITDAGYSIGELTGRTNELVFNEDGTATISKRTNTDKKKLARDFNSGELDALVLNQSASTGISLHASSKFRDQRQRVMLFAQNQLDVNTEVQMRGRIDRTGQKQRGAYRYIISAIPAEQRMIMMFKAKLKSLDANTTSSQKSKVNEIEVVDFLNKYGDEIAIEYLKENPEINIKMLDPYGISEMDDTELARFTKADGAASKVAGRAALLSVKEQEAFYSEMTEKYTTLINYLNDSGTNDLEITTLPLNAETTAKHVVIQGSNNGNPFSEDSIRETAEVDVLKKPMSMAEINEELQKLTGGLSPTEYRDMMVEKIRTHLTEQTNKETDKIQNDYAKREQAHFDKINKEIDRDIKRGEVQESDRNEILASKRELWDGSMRLAIENKTNAIRTRYESVIQIIRSLPTGRVVLIPSTLEIDATTTYSEGMFLGFRMKDKITPSTITAVFAPLDSRRRIDVPLSKVPFLQAVYAQTMQGQRGIRANKDNWDSLVPTRTRRTAYIISGNILQAYGRPELRGQLVTYTTKEGAVRQGILLPERYRHDEQTMRVQIIKKIDALRAGEDLSDQSNGVTVKKESPTSYSITVPLSRIRGGKYFLDEDLRSMVYERDFRQMAGQMVGVVSEANIERALQYLSDKFNISVNDKMKEAKEDAAFKIVGENLPATININGVERPTTNSEGKPIATTEAGIRNFYEWFSNSKVVDEQGRPLVVYHGAYENFDVFKKSELGKYTNAESAKQGFFFTDKNDLASDFAYDSARSFGKYSEKQILAQIQKADFEKINEFVTRKIKGEYDFSIYDSINEYLEDNRKIKSIEPSESEYRDAINNLAAEYLYNGMSDSDTSNEYKRIFDELGISIGYVQEVKLKIENPLVVNKTIDFEDGDGLTHYIEKAKKDGNDGVIFNNVREVILEGSKMTKQFVVFEPTQIKSATGNSGEFYADTDDIRFKIIGEKGAANLDKTEEATIRLDNLRVAKEMEKGGSANKNTPNVSDVYSSVLSKINKNKLTSYLKDNGLDKQQINDVFSGSDNYWIDQYLSDKYQISINSEGFIQFDELTPQVKEIIGNNKILLYHHTSDAIINSIAKEGIISTDSNVNRNNHPNLGVYVTTEYSGPAVDGYKYNAKQVLSGNPITLEIITTVDKLQPDNNDSDIKSGRFQFVLDKVDPNSIANIGDFITKQFTPQEIRMATGWEKGVDGLWRYEVSDVDTSSIEEDLRNNMTEAGKSWTAFSLSDFKDIAAAYPDINVDVVAWVSPKNQNTGSFSPATEGTDEYFGRTAEINVYARDVESVKNVLIHEIQHAIQEIEGFAVGGMPEKISSEQKAETLSKIEKLEEETSKYENSEEGAKMLDDKKTLEDKYLNNEMTALEYQNAIAEFGIKYPFYNGYKHDSETIAKLYRSLDPVGTYNILAGEVEARNASARMNMTAEQRRETLLSETADVAPGDQIILMDAAGDQQSTGISLEYAQWLSDTLSGVFNVKNSEGKVPTIVTVNSDELAGQLPEYAESIKKYKIHGINTGDKVYINLEHVTTKEDFIKTWLHEHIHQITIDNYTDNGIIRFYKSLPAEVKDVLRKSYSNKSDLIKGLEIIAHYTEVILDAVGVENLMNGNFDLSLVPESVRPILGEHLEIITYGNYQNNRENQLNNSRNDRGATKSVQSTTTRAGYQRDGSIRDTRRGNEDRAAFRITDEVSPLRDVIDAKLRKAVVKIGNRQLGEGFRFKVQENWQDSHIAVKHFLDVLRTNGVVIEDYNDYYLQVTQVPGRTDAQVDNYERMFHKPLMDAIGALQNEGMSYRDVENYAIMKHGIERNEFMRKQEAKIYADKKIKKPTLKEQELDIDGSVMDEYRAALEDAYETKLLSLADKDYSGITAVKEEVEMSAEEYVADIEGRATEQAINNFWTAINNATNNSLEQAFKGGSLSKATYEELKSRYQYYIPLRGFDQEIAEDRYDYAPDMGTYYSLPMISAKGRKSRSENPFAYIWQMNQSAITFANRNLLNQSIKRLSAKNTQGLLTAKKAWYMLTGEIDGVKQWELREPEYSPDWKQYQKNIETFEEEMQELEEKGFASQRGGKLNLGLFTKPKQASQHTVHVMQNGVEYVIYFNADPAVSRAINGANRTIANPGRIETFVRNASRTMAANFTTRNPVFVLSNFSRDFLYAASTLPAKESAAYAAKFVKNIPLVAASLKRAIKGKPDMTNPIDQLAVEYILNGGKTGYSSIVEIQKTQKRIERDLKRHGKNSKAEALLKGIQAANEFAENITRLSAYVTSRQEGRSIIQSISDAKELTVNFNRNGAGGYGAAFIKSYWLFVNAGIQAMANFYSIAKNHPGKTAAVVATYMAWGIVQPLLIALLGDDDDLEEYFKMSDWERQNNLIIPTGNGFIKLPFPHELRVFHAMGDNIAQAIFGYKDAGETIADTAMSFADLIPISPAGAIDASWVELLPDPIKPLAQIHFTNTNFMGGRIIDEYKTRSEVMPGYRMVRTNKKGEVLSPSFVVGMTKFLDHITGGDGTQKGLVSMNPDEVNHLLRGYFGGLYTMAVQFGGIAYSGYEWSKGGDLKVKFKDTPLKAFYTSTDELNEKNSGLNKSFYRIKNEVENALEAGKDYIKRSKDGEFDVIELTKKLNEIDYFRYYEMNERFIKPVKNVEGKLDELPDEYIKEAETIINMHKENLINFYHDGTKSGE